MQLHELHTVYFVGIGGIGMSALARYFNGRGVAVHGYDKTATPLTRQLEDEGIAIHYEESVAQMPADIDLVIYTPAIPDTHQELMYCREQGMRLKKRAEVLGIISRGMRAIAIAGTHGKTTTSSIVTHLLRTGGVDCTAFLGGIAMNLESNFVQGHSDWVVIEADEFDRSFLHLHPALAVITSTDADHLDIYGDPEQLLRTGFQAFAKKIDAHGTLWVQKDQEEVVHHPNKISYGIDTGDVRAQDVHVDEGHFVFSYQDKAGRIDDLKFPLPGRHNIENATAAIAIARHLGVSDAAIREGLSTFKGIQRRFELIYQDQSVTFFDDYAHHPSELKAAIGAAKELFPNKRITGVFQPHLFSRTRDFAAGFAEALDKLDALILLDIYPAREEPIPGITADTIRDLMQNKSVLRGTKDDVPKLLENENIEVLLTLGAGDISRRIKPIQSFLESRKVNV